MRPLPPFPSGRLPGVHVENAELPPSDALPRMDIAGFVGFAASGPLDVATPFDDPARFREIFGPDLPLARDEARGEMRTSLMGRAVEAFFANGGRRAWAVRVADRSRIRTLAFRIPGLQLANGGLARLAARSPGLWPATLACDARLTRTGLVPAGDLWSAAGGWSMTLAPTPTPPVPGDLLEIAFRAPGLVALALVERAERGTGGLFVAGSLIHWRARPAGDAGTLGAENPALQVRAPAAAQAAAGLPARPDRVARLSFDLIAWEGERMAARLPNLAFAPAHPRFWGALPSDAALFAPTDGGARPRLSPARAALIAEATAPRFPFAADLPDAGAAGAGWTLWTGLAFPWGMGTGPGRDRAQGPDVPEGAALDLDGLAVFDDRLFLDPGLARVNAGALAEAVEARRSASLAATAALAGDLRAQPPRGLHALSAAPEVSMIAIPDAVHRAWNRERPEEVPPLSAPILAPPADVPDAWGRIALSWTAAEGAESYRVERGADEAFAPPTVFAADTTAAAVPFDPDCPTPAAFRVRAERAGEIGPWSNTRLVTVPPDIFAPCAAPPAPGALILSAAPVGSPARPGLTWTPEGAPDPAETVELQSSATPSFEAPEPEAVLPGATDWAPEAALTAGRWFRARRVLAGAAGPWSNALRLAPETRADFAMVAADAFDAGALVAAHRGLIRYCAARADAVALLALPRHYRAEAAEAHLSALLPLAEPGDPAGAPAGASLVPGLSYAEERALSYAAVFHPWIGLAGPASPTGGAFLPPDGAAAGLLARRTLTEGAWISAANQPVAGAAALSPALSRDEASRLIAAQINPVLREPGGFPIFNADTLSRSADLRPLPVRRLMILLRRLALREGQAWVFEPDSPDFRAMVRARFTRLLSLIHQRGGLKGAEARAAFEVVVDGSVNPPSAADGGRFAVELRVAPSRPFRHLTVLLLQTGPQQVQVREA
ncbi:MAG: hypothetical protein VYD87_11735 [Pseudomonadota bacterium]|nr:hypothetical protein [Pseudomonadota bacterium]